MTKVEKGIFVGRINTKRKEKCRGKERRGGGPRSRVWIMFLVILLHKEEYFFNAFQQLTLWLSNSSILAGILWSLEASTFFLFSTSDGMCICIFMERGMYPILAACGDLGCWSTLFKIGSLLYVWGQLAPCFQGSPVSTFHLVVRVIEITDQCYPIFAWLLEIHTQVFIVAP